METTKLVSVTAFLLMQLKTFSLSFVSNCSITVEFRSTSLLQAAVNGLGQSVNSLLRFCGPAVAGNALGWSLHNHTYPFDYHFVYVIAAIGQVRRECGSRSFLLLSFFLAHKPNPSHHTKPDFATGHRTGHLDADESQREQARSRRRPSRAALVISVNTDASSCTCVCRMLAA